MCFSYSMVFFLSVTFSPSSLLDRRKPKCLHASLLKLAGAPADSQTLSLTSPSSLCNVRPFCSAARSVWASGAQRMMDTHGPMESIALLLLQQKKKISALFAQKTYHLKQLYVQSDIKTLVPPDKHCYISRNHTSPDLSVKIRHFMFSNPVNGK